MYISDDVRSSAVKSFSIAEGDVVYIVSSEGVVTSVIEGVIKTSGRFGRSDYAIVVDEATASILKTKVISYRDYCMVLFKEKSEAESLLSGIRSGKDALCAITKLVIITDMLTIVKLRVDDVVLDGIGIIYKCKDLNGVKYRIRASEVNNFASRRLVASNKVEALKMLDYLKLNRDSDISGINKYVLLSDVLSVVSRYNPSLRDAVKLDLENLIGLDVASLGVSRLLSYNDGFYSDNNELLNVGNIGIDLSKLEEDPALLDKVVTITFEDTMGFEYEGEYRFGEVCSLLDEKYSTENDSSVSDENESEEDEDDFNIEVIDDEDESSDNTDILTSYSNSYKYEGN